MMRRPLPLAACLALVTALPLATALAQDAAPPAAPDAAQPAPAATAAPAPAAVTGNAETGRQLTYTCQGCHGITGYKNAYPSFKVPKIGGQSAEYLSQALHEYRDGQRKHPTMRAQAESFSDQDIADIAAFLSTLK
ncbi:cytochrome c [Pseudoxanthomonas sp.]|uniref:c-type cytochrome n=1 Tax=Pseudoxanthomonas sp. TaxID=1871049 RepID=UPI0025825E58|nr:cytochrome c [Pseudoxanthomonas sp.]MCR6687515.1 cytochrome c [Pseudoxanthomonas sp.]